MCLVCDVFWLLLEKEEELDKVKCSDIKSARSTYSPLVMACLTLCGTGRGMRIACPPYSSCSEGKEVSGVSSARGCVRIVRVIYSQMSHPHQWKKHDSHGIGILHITLMAGLEVD